MKRVEIGVTEATDNSFFIVWYFWEYEGVPDGMRFNSENDWPTLEEATEHLEAICEAFHSVGVVTEGFTGASA